MNIIISEQINSDQIMIVQDTYDNLFYIIVESVQNYSFTPDFVSKPYKTKKSAMSNFNKLIEKYKGKLQ